MSYKDIHGTSAGASGQSQLLAGSAISPEPWTLDAACAQTDPELWFPEASGNVVAAKKVCGSCDVVMECLAYALRNGEEHGVWGAFSPKERRELKKGKAA